MHIAIVSKGGSLIRVSGDICHREEQKCLKENSDE